MDDLAFQLAMLTTRQGSELYRDHKDKFLAALWSNQRSCQPVQLTRRFIHATLQRRPRQFLEYVACQRVLLALAAHDASDNEQVLEALATLSSLEYRYELGPAATDKQKQGFQGCKVEPTRTRYAKLVREGEVADGPSGLRLHRARNRKLTGYLAFALLVGWTWFIFIKMAADGALGGGQLAFYMAGSAAFSAWLVRGIFTAVSADQDTVDEANRGLRLRLVRSKQHGTKD